MWADLEQAAEGWEELSEVEQLLAPAEEALELKKDKRQKVKTRIKEDTF